MVSRTIKGEINLVLPESGLVNLTDQENMALIGESFSDIFLFTSLPLAFPTFCQYAQKTTIPTVPHAPSLHLTILGVDP
jgi:hypothetical protein